MNNAHLFAAGFNEANASKKKIVLFRKYIKEIWASRYLLWHLAKSDLRNKFRRSTLGMMWCIIHPLALTLLLSFIMGALFHLALREYLLYVFSGIIIWEIFSGSLLSSCNALINAEGYIKQFRRPLAIYSLRCVIVSLISFLFAFVGFILWDVIANFNNFNASSLSLILTLPVYLFFLWPIAMIVSFITTRFRDFNQLVIILLQFLWYVSPVFFQPKMFFDIKLNYLVNYNPIFHFINLIRAPFLNGLWPPLSSYLFTLGTAFCFWLIAIFIAIKQESNIIFYL